MAKVYYSKGCRAKAVRKKICIGQNPERSDAGFQVLPHQGPYKMCFLSSRVHVQNVSTQGS